MQKEIGPANGGIRAAMSTPNFSQNQRLSASPHRNSDGCDLTSIYSIVPPPKDSVPNSSSISISPSSCSCDEENANATENRLYLATLALQYHDLYEKYGACLSRLHETTQEVEALRQENTRLRIANGDLSKRLSLLTGKPSSLPSRVGSPGFQPLSVVNDFRRLCVGDGGRNGRASSEVPETSPTSVLGYGENRFEKKSTERVTLPKSISVRSSGFLKVSPPSGSNASSSRANRFRPTSPLTVGSQRVYVPGEKNDEAALEFEVYNQGMFKTELCNKWQESGTCPYGDHCQFAHGIGELRPVIRHPRYKTEVCRMVLAGDTCPYGHRCHFRHALTEQERFVGPA
ncbi:zinc finger CCCH domain-containing protein 9 [Magnolia sinica]|uniref:zinc finger CCCH domain-containing protein 9 n=1 Tax=Magnolia sinica TaxID=86752 RepID=UPI002659697E|nr:zinc finger CCCH domain-containing protein 9 [Magnolia sinica]